MLLYQLSQQQNPISFLPWFAVDNISKQHMFGKVMQFMILSKKLYNLGIGRLWGILPPE
jgi:hypothetical protein